MGNDDMTDADVLRAAADALINGTPWTAMWSEPACSDPMSLLGCVQYADRNGEGFSAVYNRYSVVPGFPFGGDREESALRLLDIADQIEAGTLVCS